jgi:hypothetical protein
VQYAEKFGATNKRSPQPFLMSLDGMYYLVETKQSEKELTKLLAQVEQTFAACKQINATGPDCYKAHFVVYAQAAFRTYLTGRDPQPQLTRALESLAEVHKRGGSFLEIEQNDALLRYVQASQLVRGKQDPTPALVELAAALKRCVGIEAKDLLCRTLAVKQAWVESEWLEPAHKKSSAVLEKALQNALEVTQSPELYPAGWQAVAETRLRLARLQKKAAQREVQLEAGLEAVGKALAINPRLALGLVTQSELLLLRAETAANSEARPAAAKAATAALDSLFKSDPDLKPAYAPLAAKAQTLGSVQ